MQLIVDFCGAGFTQRFHCARLKPLVSHLRGIPNGGTYPEAFPVFMKDAVSVEVYLLPVQRAKESILLLAEYLFNHGLRLLLRVDFHLAALPIHYLFQLASSRVESATYQCRQRLFGYFSPGN